MKCKIVYPTMPEKVFQRKKLIKIMRWPYLAAVYICPIVNLCIGGPAWSILVLMGLYMSWNLLFSIDLVEYNRISQFYKAIIYSCIMLALIDLVLVKSGWSINVIVLTCFGSLIVVSVLLFSDFSKQKKNIMPLFKLTIISFIGSIIGLIIYKNEGNWQFVALCSLSCALLITFIIILGKNFAIEFKKRYHIK